MKKFLQIFVLLNFIFLSISAQDQFNFYSQCRVEGDSLFINFTTFSSFDNIEEYVEKIEIKYLNKTTKEEVMFYKGDFNKGEQTSFKFSVENAHAQVIEEYGEKKLKLRWKLNESLFDKKINLNFYPSLAKKKENGEIIKDNTTFNPYSREIELLPKPQGYVNPFTIEISQINDTIYFNPTVLVSGYNSEAYSGLFKLAYKYVNKSTNKEETLLNVKGFDGNYPYGIKINENEKFTNNFEPHNSKFISKWVYDKSKITDDVVLKIYSVWTYRKEGFRSIVDYDTYFPMEKKIVLPKIEIIKPKAIYAGADFKLSLKTNCTISNYYWEVEGIKRYTKEPIFNINELGKFNVKLRIKGYCNGIKVDKTFNLKDELTVVNAGNFDITDNFTSSSIEPLKKYEYQISPKFNLSPVKYTASNLPAGAHLGYSTGKFVWNTPIPGTYNFTITASDKVNTKSKEYQLIVKDYVKSNLTIKISDNIRSEIEGVWVYLSDNGSTISKETNKEGKVVFELIHNKTYKVFCTVDEVRKTKDFKITQNVESAFVFESNKVEVQGVEFTADNISIEKKVYVLKGNVKANDVLLFKGNNEVRVDFSSSNLGMFKTKNQLYFKDKQNKETILIDNSNEKSFYVYNGLIIPTKKEIFKLGELAKIKLDGFLMSFINETDDDDNEINTGIQFACFPRFPWIFGEFMNDAGYYFRDVLLYSLKSGNVDIDKLIMVGKEAAKVAVDKSHTLDTIVKSMQNLPFSMPSISLIKSYHVENGVSKKVSIENVNVCVKGMGFQDIGFSYAKEAGIETWSGKGYIKWGGKCEGSEFKIKKDSLNANNTQENNNQDDDNNSNNNGSESRRSIKDLQESLRKSFGNYPNMSNVSLEIENNNGEIIYESSYGNFIDITDDIIYEEFDTRGLSGFGVEITIRGGKLERLKLSADIPFTISPAFKLTNVNGCVEGLTEVKNGKVKYSTKNLVVSLGCNIEPTVGGSLIKLVGLRGTVKPWSYYSLEGDIQLAKKKALTGRILYDNSKKLFLADAELIPDATNGIFSGGACLSIDGKNIVGNATLNVHLPEDLPYGFGWAEGRAIGSAEVGFNNDMVGARITIGKEVTEYEKVEVRKRWGKKWKKRWKKAKKKAKKVYRKTKRYVTKAIKKVLTFRVGISYNWKTKKVKFGKNVKVPKVRRLAYRNNKLIKEFTVSDDTKAMYLTSLNSDKKFSEFRIFNPNGDEVAEDVLWCRDSANYEITAVVTFPEKGDWRVESDTQGFNDVDIESIIIDNKPQGIFLSPANNDITSTEVKVKFNDVKDTLSVGIYYDEDKQGFDGKLIKKLKVLNNASIKFNYTPKGLLPGKYHFYYSLDDGTGTPSYQYAQGSLTINPSQKISQPQNVKVQIQDGESRIKWDKPDFTKLDYVEVALKDVYTNENFYFQTTDTTFVAIDTLKIGHKYSYKVYNRSFEDEISQVVEGNFIFKSSTKNNPPMWQINSNKVFEFYEGDLVEINLDVVDPDGDDITIEAEDWNFPKGYQLKDNVFSYQSDADERSLNTYRFKAKDSKGELSEIEIKVNIKPQYANELELDFGASTLYEEDNMFLVAKNTESQNAVEKAWLYNITKNDSIQVDMKNRGNGNFIGHFELSYQRRSILPVSSGDTLIARYIYNQDTVYSISRFDSNPQLIDNSAPNAIKDLKAELLDNKIALTYTVPSDKSGKDNTIASPWYYDVRFSNKNINTNDIYLGLESLKGCDDFGNTEVGTKRSISINVNDIENYNTSHKIWFNIKSGDAKFNYSDISNSVCVNHVVNPSNLNAYLNNSNVKLTWNGPVKEENDDFLNNYLVYRKINSENYKFIGTSNTNSYTDEIANDFKDCVVTYYIVASYAVGETPKVYSNFVKIDRFSDIVLSYTKEGFADYYFKNLNYKVKDSEGNIVFEGKFGDDDAITIKNVKLGSYTVEVGTDSKIMVTEPIKVTETEREFEFAISALTNIDNIKTKSFYITPNPVMDMVYFKNVRNIKYVIVYKMNGQKVLKLKTEPNQNSINLSQLDAGIYIIEVVTDKQVFKEKLIKK